jgi:hypothetical protein
MVHLSWEWIGVAGGAMALAAGLWWVLADYILDHVGGAPISWREQQGASSRGA